MTERGRAAVERTPERLSIGPSSLRWEGGELLIDIEERTMPWLKRLRGTIRVRPTSGPPAPFLLEAGGCHMWQPIAPQADIEVELDRPDLRWRGKAYLDCNHGAEPLQDGFRRWSWSRAHQRERTIILYDVEHKDASHHALALRLGASGDVERLETLPRADLPPTAWRLDRPTRADSGFKPGVIRTLEDGPFYARSLVGTSLYGEAADAFHESLDLERFREPLVRAMLPFRMPRIR